MSKNYMTMVGTVGTGIWISGDGGESWNRCKGMWNETQVFALTPHPQNPKVIFAGGHDGIYRSDDGGGTFEPSAARPSGRSRLTQCSRTRSLLGRVRGQFFARAMAGASGNSSTRSLPPSAPMCASPAC